VIVRTILTGRCSRLSPGNTGRPKHMVVCYVPRILLQLLTSKYVDPHGAVTDEKKSSAVALRNGDGTVARLADSAAGKKFKLTSHDLRRLTFDLQPNSCRIVVFEVLRRELVEIYPVYLNRVERG
jgi:hypothetical protein